MHRRSPLQETLNQVAAGRATALELSLQKTNKYTSLLTPTNALPLYICIPHYDRLYFSKHRRKLRPKEAVVVLVALQKAFARGSSVISNLSVVDGIIGSGLKIFQLEL